MFTGRPDGRTEWLLDIENGDDAGYFGVGSAAWAVHGGMPTIVAGIRALLMQALHPGAMAGVHDWSRYREDPLGRLSGTIRWIIVVTSASSASARPSRRGSASSTSGCAAPTSPRTAPRCHTRPATPSCCRGCTWRSPMRSSAATSAGAGPIPGGPDGYVAEWAAAGQMVGVQDPPRSAGELRGRIEELRTNGTLRRDEPRG